MHYLPAEGPACRGSVRGQVTSSLSPSAVHAILQAASELTPQSSSAQLLWDVLEKPSQHPSDRQRSEGSLRVRWKA